MIAAAQLAHEHRPAFGFLITPALVLIMVGPAAVWQSLRDRSGDR